MEMFDKLQFVAGFHHSQTAENQDKLKFVGHFLSLCQQYQEESLRPVGAGNGAAPCWWFLAPA